MSGSNGIALKSLNGHNLPSPLTLSFASTTMLDKPPVQSQCLRTDVKVKSISSAVEPSMSSSSDLLMTDTQPNRPSLSTSLSDFALSSSTSSSPSSSMSNGLQSLNAMSKDDTTPLLKRVRRPTIHNWWMPEHRMQSPLSTTSFVFPLTRSAKGKERCTDNDADGGDDLANVGAFRDKDNRMSTDSSSPSSESDAQTPSLRLENSRLEELADRPKSSPMDISRSASPAAALKPPADILDAPGPNRHSSRRLSHPLKPPRLLTLRSEAQHPDEYEVKSEAQFQRFIAHSHGFPPGLRTNRSTRAPSDRGRYPEEAVADDDEFQREETPSDDEVDPEGDTTSSSYMTYKAHGGTDPINILKPSTPAPSVIGTPEDLNAFITVSESPGNVMDIDMLPMSLAGSPSISGFIPPPMQWRQTPPPTASSAVRTSKRKYDERFEPYAPSAKRRAVSPSISQLKDRDGYTLVSPIVIPRSPILKPRKSFSQSQNNSATSSPTVSQSSSYAYGLSGTLSFPLSQNVMGNAGGIVGHHRSGSSSSVASPTVRSIMLASPILRPIPRLAGGIRRMEEEEKIVDGAGENLRELNIGR